MRTTTTTIAAAVALTVAGCATPPDRVQPAYVDPMQYRDYSCDQMARSMSNRSRRIADLHGRMQKEATGDAIGVGVSIALFWPAAFLVGIDNNDAQESEYRRLTGEYRALEEQAVLKDCDVSVRSPEQRIQGEAEDEQEAGHEREDGHETP